jgi:hypothetical protein
MSKRDYYAPLGVSRDCDEDDIRGLSQAGNETSSGSQSGQSKAEEHFKAKGVRDTHQSRTGLHMIVAMPVSIRLGRLLGDAFGDIFSDLFNSGHANLPGR